MKRVKGRLMVATAAVVLLSSCSGGSDKPEAGAPSTLPQETTTSTAPTYTGIGGERFCELARSANDQLSRLVQAGPSSEAVRELFTSAADAVGAMADVAPEEIAPFARTMAGAYDDLVAALARVDWQPERLPAEADDKLNAPDVLVAGDRLQAYQQQVCKIS
jgi:hypothetical protein